MPSSQTTIENSGFNSTYIVAEKDTNSNTAANPNYDATFTNAKYAKMPSSSSPTTIRITDEQANNDTFDVYFATRLGYGQKVGNYSGGVTITINAVSNINSEICENANIESSCKVDIDQNMIPIKYAGTTSTPTWAKADPNTEGDWYDYFNQKWANAVTVTSATLNAYKSAPAGTTIPEADILGYWVYIPRYAYEVQRLNPWNKPVCGNGLAGASYQDADCDANGYQARFDIRFEKSDTPKKTPYQGLVAACNTAPTTSVGVNNFTGGTDYRNNCGVSRTYGSQTGTTWATHPAFSLDKNSDGEITANEELNGIWIGKYEVGTDMWCINLADTTTSTSCGANVSPASIYIKANQFPMAAKYIGAMFTIAKNMSPNASSITGGNTITYNTATNTMNLSSSYITRMLKNRDWGATVYLSASNYGATGQGNFKVYNNGYYNGSATSNSTTNSVYRTGCGPASSQSDTPDAICNLYYTTIGQQASTTGNVYGVYDMAGGTWEYVMANYNNIKDSTTMETMPANGFMDRYLSSDGFTTTPPAWSASPAPDYSSFDECSFATCGGQSVYESTYVQSVFGGGFSWNKDDSHSMTTTYYWMNVGATSNYSHSAGIFASARFDGRAEYTVSFHATLNKL